MRITRLLDQALNSEVERQLEVLLEADEGMYKISMLNHEPKDFSYGELRQEVERGKFFQPLFAFGKTFLTLAGLSHESVKYYASLVQFYTVYKLQRMGTQNAMHCLCGRQKILAHGLCATCYTLKRQDEEYFGGLREAVLERDGYRCRVCDALAGISGRSSCITGCLGSLSCT